MARPYLSLRLTGINGASGNVMGLLDTGADETALPSGYAALMGYGPGQLNQIVIGTADGPGVAHHARQPSSAELLGSGVAFQLSPNFVQGADGVLWGRRDVMGGFRVLFDEAGQSFTLDW